VRNLNYSWDIAGFDINAGAIGSSPDRRLFLLGLWAIQISGILAQGKGGYEKII
jgi:hypothetical protein